MEALKALEAQYDATLDESLAAKQRYVEARDRKRKVEISYTEALKKQLSEARKYSTDPKDINQQLQERDARILGLERAVTSLTAERDAAREGRLQARVGYYDEIQRLSQEFRQLADSVGTEQYEGDCAGLVRKLERYNWDANDLYDIAVGDILCDTKARAEVLAMQQEEPTDNTSVDILKERDDKIRSLEELLQQRDDRIQFLEDTTKELDAKNDILAHDLMTAQIHHYATCRELNDEVQSALAVRKSKPLTLEDMRSRVESLRLEPDYVRSVALGTLDHETEYGDEVRQIRREHREAQLKECAHRARARRAKKRAKTSDDAGTAPPPATS